MPKLTNNRPMYLAQINVARMTHGRDDRRSAGFSERAGLRLGELAECEHVESGTMHLNPRKGH